jgi:PAS domain S-box-containing protein
MWGRTDPKPTAADSSTLEGLSGYLLAVLAVGVALAFRLAVDSAWGDNRPYFTFYLAAIVTMCLAGAGPGFLSMISGLLLGTWFFVTPRHSLLQALAASWVDVVMYLVSCGVVLGFLLRAQRALARERANTRELRRQAAELQASEQRFETLAGAAFEGVLLSQQGTITDCNDQVSAIVGYSRPELIGKPVAAFLLPEQREQVLRNVREEKEATYELELICKDGVRRRVEAHGRPSRGSDGRSLRVSVLRDITEQKEREEALRRQAALIDLSPDGFFVKRRDDTITFWSQGAETLYGWTAEEAVGAKSNALLQTKFPVLEEKAFEELDRVGKWSGELKHTTKQGGTVYVESRWKAVQTEGDRIGEILESNTDISKRKRGEEALRSAKDELEQVNARLEERVMQRTRSLQETTEELNAFCYTIAHDLRSPLRTQLGFARLLMEDYAEKLGEQGTEMAQRIAVAAERQGLLIQDLLAHAKVSREDMPMGRVSIRDVVKQALADVAMDVAEKKGSVDESGLRDAVVKANASCLHLVVVNLLTNALKFVRPGTQPSIRLRSECANGRVRLWVEDNGIGIESGEMSKLFGMFQRLHAARDYPGTGMGLSIVKKAVQRMEGDLGVESVVGKGSRFWVEMPQG